MFCKGSPSYWWFLSWYLRLSQKAIKRVHFARVCPVRQSLWEPKTARTWAASFKANWVTMVRTAVPLICIQSDGDGSLGPDPFSFLNLNENMIKNILSKGKMFRIQASVSNSRKVEHSHSFQSSMLRKKKKKNRLQGHLWPLSSPGSRLHLA